MANPTKNFTDPSGTPFRMSGWITVPSGFNTGNAIPVLTGQGRLVAIQPSSFDTRLFTTFRQAMHMDLTNKVWSKIPPPPMGRQIILTFPPIYKERPIGSTGTRPSSGQVWPRFAVPVSSAVLDNTLTPTPAALPTIVSFTVSPAVVPSGGSGLLTPIFDNPDKPAASIDATIDNGIGAVKSGSSYPTGPVTKDKVFTLTVWNKDNNSVSAQRIVPTIAYADPTITSFTSTPTSTYAGGNVTLNSTFSAPGGFATVAAVKAGVTTQLGIIISGTPLVVPGVQATTTFVLTATNGAGNSVTANAQVIVTVPVSNPTISSFTAIPSSLSYGGSSNLLPVFSNGTGVIDQGIGTVVSGGSYNTGVLLVGKTYTLTVTNSNGVVTTQSVVVNVGAQTEVSTFDPNNLTSIYAPQSTLLDGTGNLLFSDYNWGIRRVSLATGLVSGLVHFSNSIPTDNYLGGLDKDSSGNIYATGNFTNVIWKVTPAGVISILAGSYKTAGWQDSNTGASAQFNSPSFLVVDPNTQDIYVSDSQNHSIRRVINNSMRPVSTWAGGGTPDSYGFGQSGYTDGQGTAARFNQPAGIVIAPDGTLYVADSANNRIRKIIPDSSKLLGVVSTYAGIGPVGQGSGSSVDGNKDTAAQFNLPVALALASNGDLYVADAGGNRIRKITAATGMVSTVAGTGVAGYVDGTKASSQFYYPYALTLDEANKLLYVVDQMSPERIRLIHL